MVFDFTNEDKAFAVVNDYGAIAMDILVKAAIVVVVIAAIVVVLKMRKKKQNK